MFSELFEQWFFSVLSYICNLNIRILKKQQFYKNFYGIILKSTASSFMESRFRSLNKFGNTWEYDLKTITRKLDQWPKKFFRKAIRLKCKYLKTLYLKHLAAYKYKVIARHFQLTLHQVDLNFVRKIERFLYVTTTNS